MPYRLGGDGSDGEIDCIHVVYATLACLGIETPDFKQSWYQASDRQILRDIAHWGDCVDEPKYNGDVVLINTDQVVFGVVWDQGILVVSSMTKRVLWQPLGRLKPLIRYCFRMKSS